MADLKKEVDAFLENGGGFGVALNILEKAIEQNDEIALLQVLRLVVDDYGGATFKWNFKHAACLTVINWEIQGLNALSKAVVNDYNFATAKCAIDFLAHTASGKLKEAIHASSTQSIKKFDLSSERYTSDVIKSEAKRCMIDIITQIEIDDKFPTSLLSSLFVNTSTEVQEQVFAAMIIRWFHFSNQSIDNFNTLISGENLEENFYHNFLKSNPYLIEPFYAKVWSKPMLGELFKPDFMIKSIDNNYTIVEIEKPWLPIFTKAGDLSAQATHAKRQALEYREWIISNHLYANKQFENIWRPFSLVIIGRERDLTEKQQERLKQENESTQGILRIVGFDWIYDRSKATFENLMRYGFNR